MKRATITISDELDWALNAYLEEQEVEQPLTSVMQAALREFLTARGYLPRLPETPLRIRPAAEGSGHRDISVEHDRYLAEAWRQEKD